MPNVYTYYDLAQVFINGQLVWEVVNYITDSTTKAILNCVCTLNVYDPEAKEDDKKEDDKGKEPVSPTDDKEITDRIMDYIRHYINSGDHGSDDTSDNTSDNAANNVSAPVVASTVANSQVQDVAKELMTVNNVSFLSLTNGQFNRATDPEYRLFIRRPAQMLVNVYLNGKLLRGDQYTIVKYDNGTFEIVIGSDVLKSLDEGTQSLKLEFSSGSAVDTNIEVK